MRKTGANDNADNSKLGTSSVMSTKGTGYAKGRPSSSSGAKKSTNEFISGQLDPDKIDEYVYPSLTSICSPKIWTELTSTLLQEFEKTSIAEKKFKDAELAAKRIKELLEQEQEYRKHALKENAESEVLRLGFEADWTFNFCISLHIG